MLGLQTVSALLGAAFGLRFGVLILIPVMALELAIDQDHCQAGV